MTTPPWGCDSCRAWVDVRGLTAPWWGPRIPSEASPPSLGVAGLQAGAQIPSDRVVLRFYG
eukprot:378438-Alexandrium_andersonii.AAC.1